MSATSSIFILLAVTLPCLVVTVSGAHPCSLANERWIQGVFTRGGSLYLLINDELYSLPFDTSHIDSSGRRIKLFGAQYQKHQNWRHIVWLQPLPTAIGERRLIQLNVLPTERSDAEWAIVVLGKNSSASSFMSQRIVKLREKDDGLDLGHFAEKYVILGNGAMGGYIMRIGTSDVITDQSTIATKPYLKELEYNTSLMLTYLPRIPLMRNSIAEYIFIVLRSLDGVSTYKIKPNRDAGTIAFQLDPNAGEWVDAKGEIFFENKPTKHYGFIYGGVVHYWNFFDDHVYLFKDPASGGTPRRMYKVPMAEYFACNKEMWNKKDEEETTPKESNILSEYLPHAAIFFGIMMIIFGLIMVCCCCYRRRAKKRTFSSKSSDTLSSSDHGRKRKRTAPSPMRSPFRSRRSPRPSPSGRRGRSVGDDRLRGGRKNHSGRSGRQTRSAGSKGRSGSRHHSHRNAFSPPSPPSGDILANGTSPTAFIFPTASMNSVDIAEPIAQPIATSACNAK